MHETLGDGLASVQGGGLQNLNHCLERVLRCLDRLDGDYSDNRKALDQISDRLTIGQFRLAVLGQFKRGKSTLLNALLGDNLLPTDILPVTAIPTFISFSEQLSVCVHFTDGKEKCLYNPSEEISLEDFLAEYVTEKGNPNNLHRVDRVDIGHPSELLRQGVVLIDTPGIGSTHKHNTEVAHQILPQCDAALFLVSPDPPITEVELEYLKKICQKLPRTFYLLNKIDYLNDTEMVASLKFLADQLTPLLDGVPQILPVSARKGLQARLNGDSDGWKESGMYQVDQNLIDFFAREKQQILIDSLGRRITDQLNQICLQIQLSLKALSLSEEELKRRVELFRHSLPDVEREKIATRDVLSGDLKRIEANLTEEVESIRKKAKEQILTEVDALFQSVGDTEELERQVRVLLAENLPRFFTSEMGKISDIIQKRGTVLLEEHRRRTDGLIEKVRQNAAELFDIPYRAPSVGEVYMNFAIPGWSADLFISDMDPLGQKISRKFLTKKFRHRRAVNRLRDESLKLIGKNVEQINWALRQSLEESFRQFGAGLHEQLDKTIHATRSAMEIALEKSENHAYEKAGQELQLREVLSELQQVLDILDKNGSVKEE